MAEGTATPAVETKTEPVDAKVQAAEAFSSDISGLGSFLSEKTKQEANEIHKKLLTDNVDKKDEGKKPDGKTEPTAEEKAKLEADAKKVADDKLAADEKVKNEAKDDKTKSIFGLNKNKDKKPSDIVIENEGQILEVVKSKFGIEAKEIKDLPKFFESAQQWRKDSQSLEAVKKEAADYKEVLEGLPEDMIDAIKMHYRAEDYTKAFANKPKFNFSLAADKQDVKALVDHYYPGKFTAEDFKEGEENPNLDLVKSLAVDKYNLEKTSRDNQRIQYTQNATKQLEAFKSSVSSSVAALSQSFPDVDQDALNSIKGILDGGREKLIEVFCNKDGTVKKEAAEQVMMALYGKAEIERMMGIASHITETKINEDILSKGTDKPNPAKSASNTQEIPAEVKAKIEELRTLKKKNTF